MFTTIILVLDWYNPHHEVIPVIDHKVYVANLFAGFKGKVHCDADPFFEILYQSDDVIPSYCNAHAKQYFETIANDNSTGLSYESIHVYNRYFDLRKSPGRETSIQLNILSFVSNTQGL